MVFYETVLSKKNSKSVIENMVFLIRQVNERKIQIDLESIVFLRQLLDTRQNIEKE